MTQLGRGGSHLHFTPHTVVKTCHEHMWQSTYMNAFPDVFMEVITVEPYTDKNNQGVYTMVRGTESRACNLHDALENATPRLTVLWAGGMYPQSFDWRLRLRAHIYSVISRNHLDISMVTAALILDMLPEVTVPRFIHGDATLANCVYDTNRRGWYWIDPLIRSYIPGDPHVDLGKMFQSCFGYESILERNAPHPGQYDTQTMLNLLRQAQGLCGMSLDLTHALLWSLIHIIRLIPYQDPALRETFQQMFRDVWSWI